MLIVVENDSPFKLRGLPRRSVVHPLAYKGQKALVCSVWDQKNPSFLKIKSSVNLQTLGFKPNRLHL